MSFHTRRMPAAVRSCLTAAGWRLWAARYLTLSKRPVPGTQNKGSTTLSVAQQLLIFSAFAEMDL
jgi:hypothetical protein